MRLSENSFDQVSAPVSTVRTANWRWGVSNGKIASPEAEFSPAWVCENYWNPLYFYLRRLGHRHEDAQDLVQGFFAQLLTKDYLRSFDPIKGRFRTYLLTMLNRFRFNEWDRNNRQKRGGAVQFVSLDVDNATKSYLAKRADQHTPEKFCELHWARLLLNRVLVRLEQEFLADGKEAIFNELKVFLTGDKSESTYAEIASRLGMSEGNVKVTVYRLRQRYRELLRDEIAATGKPACSIDEEIRDLFASVS